MDYRKNQLAEERCKNAALNSQYESVQSALNQYVHVTIEFFLKKMQRATTNVWPRSKLPRSSRRLPHLERRERKAERRVTRIACRRS